MAAARRRLNSLTKPRGSLGVLESVVVQLAGITGREQPTVDPGVVLVLAGDHGVVAEGVSAYPAEVTPQMVLGFLSGGAAINALAGQVGLTVRVADFGVAVPVDHPGLLQRNVRRGTANLARGPAMTQAEAVVAVERGIDLAEAEADGGAGCILLGEMGIGNTTPASCILAALTGQSPRAVCGPGTGLDGAGVQRKAEVVERALAVNRPDPSDPWDVLHKVGGLEIAGLVGVILGAARRRLPVLVDGFITTAAALVAARLEPRVQSYLIASHRSAEPGHAIALQALGLDPLLRLQMRLGEGSGAAAAYPLLQAACACQREMATFAEAGIADQEAAPAPPAHAPTDSPAPAAAVGVPVPPAGNDFTPAEREGVYKAIFLRRDIRRFLPLPVPDELLHRLLVAAHHGPSVGYSQPWSFITIRSGATKQRLWELVERERQAQAIYFQGHQADLFPKLKVEGLREAPVTICVTCDPTRGGAHVFGRNTIPETDVLSVACAIENMWLAARSEGLGLGWVSFYKQPDVRDVLGIPPHVDPVALLCIGYTDELPDRPLLETAGWAPRLDLQPLIHSERWSLPGRD